MHRGAGHSIEGRGILAEVSDRETSVWASTQKAHDLRYAFADYIDLDENRLRVATPDVGGGFGPKLCVYPEDVAVVAAATLLRRPIKWIEDRREHFTNAAQERDQYWSIEIAADADGRVRGMRGRLIHDIGAYALQDVNIPYNSATHAHRSLHGAGAGDGCARGPHQQDAGVLGARRRLSAGRLCHGAADGSPGARAKVDRAELAPPQSDPGGEDAVPQAAEDARRREVQYDSGDYPGCQAEILQPCGWDDFPRRQAAARAARPLSRHRAWRTASRVPAVAHSNSAACACRRPAASPCRPAPRRWGRGSPPRSRKSAPQLSACAPRMSPSSPAIPQRRRLGLGGFASRQTVTAGSSVHVAAQAVAAKARKLASHVLEAAEDDLEVVDGEVRVVGAPQLSVKLGELARILKGAPGYGFPPGIDPGLEASAMVRVDKFAYANACHVVEVEVDIETGGVRIVRYVAIQDAGRRVNPMIVEGQIHGGIAHGIGNALFEWMGYDAAGQPVTTTFADYLLPTATEVPKFETLYKETPSPHNPLGVKGVGEARRHSRRRGADLRHRGCAFAVQRAHRADADHAARARRDDRTRQNEATTP